MRKILLFALLLFVSMESFGQCPSMPLTLSTQAEVDAFNSNYPGCSILDQDLTIADGDISSLVGLSQLNQINAQLHIQSDGLTNLIGLENITYIDYLNIDLATSLSSLTGLEGLTAMRALRIYDCNELTNLEGLNNVSVVSERIDLERNRNLLSLDGFQNITMDAPQSSLRMYLNFDLETLGDLFISVPGQINIDFSQNLSLVNLQGLEAVTRTRDLELFNTIDELSGLENVQQIDGALRIFGNNSASITSLQPLEGLIMTGTHATQDNLIGRNFYLEDIDGLFAPNTILRNGMALIGNYNLQSMDFMLDVVAMEGQLTIWDMEQFSDLSSFQNLTGDLTAVSVHMMDNISNLDPLSGITGISEFVFISLNPNLENLDGLSNVVLNSPTSNDGMQRLLIKRNDALTDISGISGLDLVSNNDHIELDIEENPLLAVCDYSNICALLENSGSAEISIFDNATGCANEVEVAEACGLLVNSILGEVKFDFNADGCDPADFPASRLQVAVDDGTDSFVVITGNEGDYAKALFNDGTFTTSVVSASLPEFFEATPASQNTTFVGLNNEEVIDFCITATQFFNDLKISLIPITPARPGFDSNYRLVYENVGTTQLSGQVTFEFEETRQTFIEALPLESSIAGGLVTWDFIDLNPFEARTIQVTLNNFPPPTNEIGDELPLEAQVFPLVDDEHPLDNTVSIKQIVVGAFDPNDKTVVQGEQIPEEAVGRFLDYVVRFQNNGNADAINVLIEDELDVNLQWNTLRPLSASHNYRVEISDGNKVSFIFEDINLPPEMTDPEGSQGYIAFQVKTKDDLVVGDMVENSAAIFFDFNPPIITNTVSTMVVDLQPPVANCQSITVSLDANGMVEITPADIDNGSSDTNGIASIELDVTSFDCSHLGENTVTLTVTDTYGNTSDCTAIVTVIDDLAPVLACQPITVELDATGHGSIDAQLLLDMIGTADNCGIQTIAASVSAVDCNDIGAPLEVFVFAEDISGNTSSCSTTLSVVDLLPPVFDTTTLPSDETRVTDETGTYSLEDFTAEVISTDNCTSEVIITQSPEAGELLVPGMYNISIITVDEFDNSEEYSFELTVDPLLGITNFYLEENIRVYPNPVVGKLQVESRGRVRVEGISVYSIFGKELISTSHSDIDVSGLSTGIYFLQINTDRGVVARKIIKE
ncbi:MAG: T9SS type A sorting domain-containing protein [Bacteroidota bacterium]